MAGYTKSFGAGIFDAWLLKLDSAGTVQWQKTYGGGGEDFAWSIQQTGDGGYIVAGSTHSFDAGSTDFWVLKLKPDGTITPSCDFIQDTNVSGIDTSVVPVDTSVRGINSNATPQPTDADVQDTDVEPNFLCRSEVEPPVADFSCDPESGPAPLTVHFVNNSQGEIESCEWDFGDGTSIVTGCDDQEHTYLDEGTYTVTLTVTGPGGTDTAECTIEVTPSVLEKPTGVKHVVIIDIDGLRYDALMEYIRNNKHSFLAEIVGNDFSEAIYVENCWANLPSVTGTGQATIFTGCYPAKHGIYGNIWYERTSIIPQRYSSSSPDGNRKNLKVQTLYEAAANSGFSSLVVFNPIVAKEKWNSPIYHRPIPITVSDFFTCDVKTFDAGMIALAVDEVIALSEGLQNETSEKHLLF